MCIRDSAYSLRKTGVHFSGICASRIRPRCGSANKPQGARLTGLATRERSRANACGDVMFRFADLWRRAGLAIAACCLVWSVALAQQALFVGIDPIRASLDQ